LILAKGNTPLGVGPTGNSFVWLAKSWLNKSLSSAFGGSPGKKIRKQRTLCSQTPEEEVLHEKIKNATLFTFLILIV
jgi:hypothetical protein